MDRRVELTAPQAQVLKRYYAAQRAAQERFAEALLLAGVAGRVTGGDLDAAEPYLTVEDEGGENGSA